LNDITATGIGTSGVDGFIPQLYNYMEDSFCIDTTREYASGMSNGAMFAYQSGASMSSRLAAMVPVAGSFHQGFLQSPSSCVPLMDIHGTTDTTVPSNTTRSADGWLYTVTSDIMEAWVEKCGGSTKSQYHYTTPCDGKQSMYCAAQGSDLVVRCSWNGGHSWPSCSGELVWYFLNQHTNDLHVGKGRVKGVDDLSLPEPMSAIKEVYTLPDHTTVTTDMWRKFTGLPFELRSAPVDPSKGPHYSNPNDGGCLSDEDMLEVEGGVTCAPRVKSDSRGLNPQCILGGGTYEKENQCPTDTPAHKSYARYGAFPTCLGYPSPSAGGYHCLLSCGPCREEEGNDSCLVKAHASCPEGATCKVGLHKNIHLGTCVYPKKKTVGTRVISSDNSTRILATRQNQLRGELE